MASRRWSSIALQALQKPELLRPESFKAQHGLMHLTAQIGCILQSIEGWQETTKDNARLPQIHLLRRLQCRGHLSCLGVLAVVKKHLQCLKASSFSRCDAC